MGGLMRTFYPEIKTHEHLSATEKLRRFTLAEYRFLLAGVIALFIVVLPWRSAIGHKFADTKSGRLPTHEKTIRDGVTGENGALSNVLTHFRSYRRAIRNRRYLTVIDYSKPSHVKRMLVIDMKRGKVERFLVSHGKNSGWAYATTFSNRLESCQSSRGFFITGKEYYGKHGIALQLHGLEKGVNDNALRRGIVMHGANYVSARSVMLNGGRLGRSLGCPAIPAEVAKSVINRIKGGSLVYIHAGDKWCGSEGSKRAVKHRS